MCEVCSSEWGKKRPRDSCNRFSFSILPLTNYSFLHLPLSLSPQHTRTHTQESPVPLVVKDNDSICCVVRKHHSCQLLNYTHLSNDFVIFQLPDTPECISHTWWHHHHPILTHLVWVSAYRCHRSFWSIWPESTLLSQSPHDLPACWLRSDTADNDQ